MLDMHACIINVIIICGIRLCYTIHDMATHVSPPRLGSDLAHYHMSTFLTREVPQVPPSVAGPRQAPFEVLPNSFPQFMEQECASALLQFWLTAENFYNELSSPQHIPDMEADTSDAIAIYNRLYADTCLAWSQLTWCHCGCTCACIHAYSMI